LSQWPSCKRLPVPNEESMANDDRQSTGAPGPGAELDRVSRLVEATTTARAAAVELDQRDDLADEDRRALLHVIIRQLDRACRDLEGLRD
jgi:hypothetical protein